MPRDANRTAELFVSDLRPQVDDEPTYSVSQLNELVQAVLHEQFPRSVWVRGEIQGYDQRKHRQTVSFTLAEKSPDSDDVLASVTAIMFAEDRQAIEAVLRCAENAFELQDGIEVRFKVDVDLWVKAGRYQLRVRGIDPTYTLGRLAQNRRRIIEQLTKQELLHRNKLVPLPLVPLRVGLIAAEGSAGLNDFVTHLRQSRFAFCVHRIDAAMQGKQVEADVSRAVRSFNATKLIDVIVITRGGGGATDLSWFDRYGLAEAIATSRLAVLTGLGHTHDTSVADLVAHANLKTPTDVAQFLVDRVEAFLDSLDEAAAQLGQYAGGLLQDEHDRLRSCGQALVEAVQSLVAFDTVWLAHRQGDLVRWSESMVATERQVLRGCSQRLTPARIHQLIDSEGGDIEVTWRRLVSQGARLLQRVNQTVLDQRRAYTSPRISRLVSAEQALLRAAADKAALLDPIRTLKRGFSIARTASGDLVSTVTQVKPAEPLITQLADGSIQSRVESVEPSKEGAGG